MKRFKNILLYAGGDVSPQPAIERAAELATANGARLTLVDVLPEEPAGPWMAVPGRAELERVLITARREELEELAAPLRARGIEIDCRILVGIVFVELIRKVQRSGHDLVIKTAQGAGGALGGILGSTAFHLLRKCPCPVWAVKPGEASRGRVLAAVDPNPESPADDALSRTVLELASSLARSKKAELDIVHAWWLWSEPMLRSRRLNMPPERVDEIVEESRAEARRSVEALLATVDLDGVDFRLHIEQGRPFEVISAFSKRSDVAVLGTLSRAGIAGVLIGNTAERVLHQVDCSVFAVKPPGFESPVTLPAQDLELSA